MSKRIKEKDPWEDSYSWKQTLPDGKWFRTIINGIRDLKKLKLFELSQIQNFTLYEWLK